ncbi:transposase [Actinomadura geliboluensis]|uniref:transposase n=1 Tax=Actinomadura geliboluensis TaxID=882440 RepID=UPI0036B311DB
MYPRLIAVHGVDTDTAGQILVTAGENHHRLHSEAAFAMLCGAAALPAFSGKTNRHRLNRGGDRQANAALHRIVLIRMRWDPNTRAYVERRTKYGLSKTKIMRCLKRYVAREIYQSINTTTTLDLAA